MRVGLIDDPRFEVHDQGAGHPEAPGRVRAIRQALDQAGLTAKMLRIEARQASRDELLLVHSPEYIDLVEKTFASPVRRLLGPDVVVGPGSWEAALLAAGSGIEAVQRVLRGECLRFFCNLRPPGHHASRSQAMGFCIFNNVALAAAWALENGGSKRVAILDWDVHHGNGTQDIFWEEPRVLYVSLHQHPFYPGTGAVRERPNLLNVPLAEGSGVAAYLAAFHSKALPALTAFEPELLLISCGFDAHKDDPLGGLGLTEVAYAEMTREACKLADGRVVSMLEGGYDLQAIAASACAHVQGLIDF